MKSGSHRFAVLMAFCMGTNTVGVACSMSASRAPRTVIDSRGAVDVLIVRTAKLPPVPSPLVTTRGNYVEVDMPNGSPLQRVNKLLRAAVVADEHRYAQGLPTTAKGLAPGLYRLSPRLAYMSASTSVVSLLIPTLELYPPGGTEGAGWLSVTVDVARGRPVGIKDFFRTPRAGLVALSRAARRHLIATNGCVSSSKDGRGESFVHGFDPTANDYRNFVLRPKGLILGFGNGHVSLPACGRTTVFVPYAVIRPYLNANGLLLISGVRRPRG